MNIKSHSIRITSVFVCLLILAMTLIPGASAAPVIDVNAGVSVSVIHTENTVPVVGEEFRLYKVADVDKYGNFTLIEPFTSYPVDVNVDTVAEWRGVAGALDAYVERDGIEPLSKGKTNSAGKVNLTTDEKMTPGLYLIGGTHHIQGKYEYISAPFCLTLPLPDDNGGFIYDVTARPKFASRIETGEDDVTITRRVLKKWVDGNDTENRPEKISVSLLMDGLIYSTVELSRDNDWAHTWHELDPSHHWTIIENDPGDYKVSVVLSGVTFLLTNTKDEPPEEETTVPDEETTLPEETTSPEETTTSPEDTTSPDEVTTLPEDTTSPEETTTSPEETYPPEETTTSPEETYPPEEITTSPEDTTDEEGSFTLPGDEPTRKPEEEEKLPHTGQLWWPVPTLIAAGLFSIVLGQLRNRRWEDE